VQASPLLYSLFTHGSLAKHNSNTIKFADDTTVGGLITDDNETAYREGVRDLAVWCQDNNFSLNISKTKELIVDYRKRRSEHPLIHIDVAVVDCATAQQVCNQQDPQQLLCQNTAKQLVK
jgi:hypothetical protein